MNYDTAQKLSELICAHFGVCTPTIELRPRAEAPAHKGRVTLGGFIPGERRIVLWKHSETLLAHELGHHIQEELGTPWPIPMRECFERWPEACARAMEAISKTPEAYPTAAIRSEELFARVLERIWRELVT